VLDPEKFGLYVGLTAVGVSITTSIGLIRVISKLRDEIADLEGILMMNLNYEVQRMVDDEFVDIVENSNLDDTEE
jgi:hypothetical protein